MAFDAYRDRLVALGDDVHESAGNGWTHDYWDPEALYPPERAWAATVFADRLNGVLVAGGLGYEGPIADTWLWDGSEWRDLTPEGTPVLGRGSAACWDTWRGQMVLVGGFGTPAGTWLFSYENQDPPEHCENESDDDGDGLVDCADPDCHAHASCAPAEDCRNGEDDNGDGLVDCADPACGGIRCGDHGRRCMGSTCSCPIGDRERLCDNGEDDNCDGRVDCQDPDCDGKPYCEAGGLCQPWQEIACNAIVNGTSLGAPFTSLQYAGEWGSLGSSPKAFYLLTSPADGPVSVLASGAGLAVTGAVFGPACDPLGHLMGKDLRVGNTRVDFEARAGDRYFVIVDMLSAPPGPFELRVGCH
jgi:hypothetical protein